jgi:hypothetical protein
MAAPSSSDLVAALEASRLNFEAASQGLSDAEASKKPASDSWSVLECIEHICIVETITVGRMKTAETAEAVRDSAKEAMVAARAENRGSKIQGPALAMPKGRFTTLPEAMTEFGATRSRTIAFVESCPNLDCLRLTHPLFGPLTGREYILLNAAHSNRHAAQIREIREQMGQ